MKNKQLAVIYHSAHGHTGHIAGHILAGARSVPGIDAHLLKAEELTKTPEHLLDYDGFVFGSPTYLGGVSGTFKTFMDATGRLWKSHALKGKLASAFTVSGSWSGMMAQAGHSAPADSFVPGDIKTARMFGTNVAEALLRMAADVEAEVTP
jgi:multimeric flavodoxin WrbA